MGIIGGAVACGLLSCRRVSRMDLDAAAEMLFHVFENGEAHSITRPASSSMTTKSYRTSGSAGRVPHLALLQV